MTTPQKPRELVERLREVIEQEVYAVCDDERAHVEIHGSGDAALRIEALLATPQDQAGETLTAEPAGEPVQKMHELPAGNDVDRLVVPREPTPEMIEAALETGSRFGKPAMRAIWSKMLAAAPKHPADDLRRTREADCVFCDPTRIASVVAIMDDMMVFEPVSPVAAGHLLVAPRDHVPDFTTSPYITAAVMQVAAKVAALKGGDFNLITSAGLSATQSVRHLHIHLVPRVQGDGLKLPWSCDKETLNVNAVR